MDCKIYVCDSNVQQCADYRESNSARFLNLSTGSSDIITWDIIYPSSRNSTTVVYQTTYISSIRNYFFRERNNIKRRTPYLSLSIFIITCLIFFYGIFFIITWNKAKLSLWNPISPPNDSWFFLTVNSANSCSDSRNEVWRTISYQFVHGGIAHIGLNAVVGCLYGCLFETYHPFGHLAFGILYESSVVLGALGHAIIWPYKGIYGCSAGVYGLIGGCWALIIFNRDGVDAVIYSSLLITLIIQFIFDILYYNFFYSENVSYAGHAFGFYTGICVGLTFGLFYVKEKWKKGIAIIGCCGLILEIVFLYTHFYSNWPPVAYEQPFIHNNLVNNDDCYIKLNHKNKKF